jgi:signal transduction histidine kinase
LVTLGVAGILIVAAALVASLSYERSRDYTATARHDRADNLAALHALNAFWRERASMDEYLLTGTHVGLADVQLKRLQFMSYLAQVNPESPIERTYLAQAGSANAVLLSLLPRRSASGEARGRSTLSRLKAGELAVTAPLNHLIGLNEGQYLQREAISRSAARRAVEIEIASALLALAALGWFAFIAVRLVRAVDDQNQELRGVDLAKDDFISTISHELRTPITSIQGYIELLLDEDGGPLTEEQRTFMMTVQRSSSRLLGLVNDLLLVAQARAGRLEMNKTRCDLVEVARLSAEAAFAAANKKGVHVTLSLPGPVVLDADPMRLGQAIDNLISNAVKFTPAGGSVEVALATAADRVEISVTDTGTGMTSEEAGAVFDRFFRTESANANQIQGTGLGLAITKLIVEAHAGTIAVSSEQNVGTTFRISLPREPRKPVHVASASLSGIATSLRCLL